MIRGLQRYVAQYVPVLVLTAAALGLAGCAVFGSTQGADQASDVIGTWAYRTSGSQPLSTGTLQITTAQGRLMARLRDAELGTVPIDARIYGERLTLRMDLFRIGPVSVSGKVEGDQFRGLVDRPTYDVTMSQDKTSRSRQTVRGSFLAQRRASLSSPLVSIDCPRLGPDGLQPCR